MSEPTSNGSVKLYIAAGPAGGPPWRGQSAERPATEAPRRAPATPPSTCPRCPASFPDGFALVAHVQTTHRGAS